MLKKKRLDDIEKAKVDEFDIQLNKWEHGKTTLEKQIQSFKAKVKHNQATIDLKVEAMIDGKVKDVECKSNHAKELKSIRHLLIDHASTKPKKPCVLGSFKGVVFMPQKWS